MKQNVELSSREFREETDSLGKKELPADALWGIHTARAMENFTIAGRRVNPKLTHAYAIVKKAAAKTNRESGYLEKRIADAIIQSCDMIISGQLDDAFPIDALQGGAGTSLNMNLNEVIANQSNLILKAAPGGDNCVDPLRDVNMHQSTNDTFPTALKICLIGMFRELSGKIETLQGAFQQKEKEFANIVTIGRTEWQSAVPMTLGTIFSTFSESIGRDRWRTFKCEERLRVVNIGGTAVGTGLTAPQRYIFRVVDHLRDLSGFGLARAENLVDNTANTDTLVEAAGILGAHAVNLQKASKDLRMLAFNGEIELKAVQAGSSIMPGKVNPVIPEAVIQAAMKARSNTALIAEIAAEGSLQINEFLPLLADTFIETLNLLTSACKMLTCCVEAISANPRRCEELVSKEPMVLTALIPHIGYAEAAKLVEDYTSLPTETRPPINDYLKEKVGTKIVEKSFTPAALSALGYQD